jgi:hypothetical protein
MTALTVPTRPAEEDDASLPPIPWRRMAGVSWRQHRYALAGVAVLLGALSVYLWLAGLQLRHAYAAAIGCRPAGSPSCQVLIDTFNGMNGFLSNGSLLQALPPLIGAFVGAPVLARELETGSYRFAWTQGFGRWRWAVAKLVLLAVVVTAATAAFSALLTWYYQPYLSAGQPLGVAYIPPFFPGVFDLREVAFPAWTLAAFSIGALAGMLIRRVVPAIAATLVGYAAFAFAAGGYLREHYLTPLVTINNFNLPSSSWIISQWWTRGGTTVSESTLHQVMLPLFTRFMPPVAPDQVHLYKPSTLLTVERYLSKHGYTQWTSYQPASRFWTFQWIEGGWLFLLSALLIAATIWLVRRKAA